MKSFTKLILIALLATILTSCAVGCVTNSTHVNNITATSDRNTLLATQLNEKAIKQIKADNLAEAEKTLNKAITADRMYVPANNNLGFIYLQTNRLYQAATIFERVIKLDPVSPHPRYNLGLVFQKADRPEEAIRRFEQARRIDPNNIEILTALTATRLQRGDRDKELLDYLQQIILQDPRPKWQDWARRKLALFEPKDEVDQ